MSVLFDYGEALLCFVPLFFMISFIGAALLWNSLPPRSEKEKQ
jgi:hypothetical protein